MNALWADYIDIQTNENGFQLIVKQRVGSTAKMVDVVKVGGSKDFLKYIYKTLKEKV